jgi:hypothetical protein
MVVQAWRLRRIPKLEQQRYAVHDRRPGSDAEDEREQQPARGRSYDGLHEFTCLGSIALAQAAWLGFLGYVLYLAFF